mmetsp:Transcript_12359/g.38123  ORF Transcript_12359/g.38123 Transcript_12359/m.38123 type:complete len:507 (-) Transcript_12359:1415-2935(-)
MIVVVVRHSSRGPVAIRILCLCRLLHRHCQVRQRGALIHCHSQPVERRCLRHRATFSDPSARAGVRGRRRSSCIGLGAASALSDGRRRLGGGGLLPLRSDGAAAAAVRGGALGSPFGDGFSAAWARHPRNRGPQAVHVGSDALQLCGGILVRTRRRARSPGCRTLAGCRCVARERVERLEDGADQCLRLCVIEVDSLQHATQRLGDLGLIHGLDSLGANEHTTATGGQHGRHQVEARSARHGKPHALRLGRLHCAVEVVANGAQHAPTALGAHQRDSHQRRAGALGHSAVDSVAYNAPHGARAREHHLEEQREDAVRRASLRIGRCALLALAPAAFALSVTLLAKRNAATRVALDARYRWRERRWEHHAEVRDRGQGKQRAVRRHLLSARELGHPVRRLGRAGSRGSGRSSAIAPRRFAAPAPRLASSARVDIHRRLSRPVRGSSCVGRGTCSVHIAVDELNELQHHLEERARRRLALRALALAAALVGCGFVLAHFAPGRRWGEV